MSLCRPPMRSPGRWRSDRGLNVRVTPASIPSPAVPIGIPQCGQNRLSEAASDRFFQRQNVWGEMTKCRQVSRASSHWA
jgi:hypothetical protein